MSEERFITIETKIAYQERTITEQGELIYEQEKRIKRLEKMCSTLIDHLKRLQAASDTIGPHDEKPPHY